VPVANTCHIWMRPILRENRLLLNPQGSDKYKQDQRYLQESHCGLACDALDEVSICLSRGMALPNSGYRASA